MATALNFTTAKSWVISLLQASRTPWASTVDGSNAQYSSDSEISSAILTADLECATLICNAPLSPYQTQFVAAAATLLPGANTPIRNGMILRVTGASGVALTTTFTAGQISTTTDLVTVSTHGLVTGQAVQVSAGTTLPTGLVAATTYYIYAPTTSTYGFCTTIYNAKTGTLIDITNVGSGTNTVTTQYTDILQADSKATITQAVNSPYLFSSQAGNVAGFWFVEGDTFYSTCPSNKMYYTDVTLTASPQCPEPLLFAVVAGAIAKLSKDGSDAQMTGFYAQQYQGYMQQIASGAMAVPTIQSYTGGVSA